ncbi:hypothetical protein P0R31_40565, partial [Bradyrhizobium yuanmingense]|uniref:hypothetical protein n=1 Tax=Bradyrhizobium yuanmingense TaxID=108015 RepID=UPI0023B9AE7C
RNGRSAAQPRPAPPIVRCSTRATWRTKPRDSNCRWMKIQGQVMMVLSYNFTRVLSIFGIQGFIASLAK